MKLKMNELKREGFQKPKKTRRKPKKEGKHCTLYILNHELETIFTFNLNLTHFPISIPTTLLLSIILNSYPILNSNPYPNPNPNPKPVQNP